MTADADQTRTTGPGDTNPTAGPDWLTVRETARHVRRSYETVRRACVEYQRTDGRYGLKCSQPRPRAKILIRPADALRWINGAKPDR